VSRPASKHMHNSISLRIRLIRIDEPFVFHCARLESVDELRELGTWDWDIPSGSYRDFEAGGLTPVFTLNTACGWFTLSPKYRPVPKCAKLIGVEGLFYSTLDRLASIDGECFAQRE
jgi:hypothetical protein